MFSDFRFHQLYSFDEVKSFLVKKGFKVKEVDEEMCWSRYHNQVETGESRVWGVFDKKGKAFCKPLSSNFAQYDWVNRAFDELLRETLLSL